MAKQQSLVGILKEMQGTTALHENLGEFICNYARVEHICHLVFDQVCGLARPIAREIMGGARLADVLRTLSKVVELSKQLTTEQKAEFKRCNTHLNLITEFRHRLIHRGASAEQEQITSTNELLAKSKEAIEILKFHVNDLKDAANDCFNMEVRLLYVVNPKIKDALGAELAPKIFGPWRYKHVQPDRPHQPPRKGQASRRRQLQSFRA